MRHAAIKTEIQPVKKYLLVDTASAETINTLATRTGRQAVPELMRSILWSQKFRTNHYKRESMMNTDLMNLWIESLQLERSIHTE